MSELPIESSSNIPPFPRLIRYTVVFHIFPHYTIPLTPTFVSSLIPFRPPIVPETLESLQEEEPFLKTSTEYNSFLAGK